jgi:hypothetical protein
VPIAPGGENREISPAVACDYRRTLEIHTNKHRQLEGNQKEKEKRRTAHRHLVRINARVQADIFDCIQTVVISRTQFPLENELHLIQCKYVGHTHQFSSTRIPLRGNIDSFSRFMRAQARLRGSIDDLVRTKVKLENPRAEKMRGLLYLAQKPYEQNKYT